MLFTIFQVVYDVYCFAHKSWSRTIGLSFYSSFGRTAQFTKMENVMGTGIYLNRTGHLMLYYTSYISPHDSSLNKMTPAIQPYRVQFTLLCIYYSIEMHSLALKSINSNQQLNLDIYLMQSIFTMFNLEIFLIKYFFFILLIIKEFMNL